MVVKLRNPSSGVAIKFESDVILNGGQASRSKTTVLVVFESDVILNGGQAKVAVIEHAKLFESDVILNGGQASSLTDSTLLYV